MELKKQKALEFISKSIGKINDEEIISSLVVEHGYSINYSKYLLRSFAENKSLRKSLEDIEKREEKVYLKRQQQLILDRPKIFINYGSGR